jgi:hypothetical protein
LKAPDSDCCAVGLGVGSRIDALERTIEGFVKADAASRGSIPTCTGALVDLDVEREAGITRLDVHVVCGYRAHDDASVLNLPDPHINIPTGEGKLTSTQVQQILGPRDTRELNDPIPARLAVSNPSNGNIA